jgi:hypothetical protein
LIKVYETQSDIEIESNTVSISALDFWKKHKVLFPSLDTLAMKYLGVQASSDAVERMLSISGHIFSLKR